MKQEKGIPSPDVFLKVLGEYSSHLPYSTNPTPREAVIAERLFVPHQASLVRFLPLKQFWVLSELIAFDGEDFAYAATRSLRLRAPTAAEVQRFSTPHKVSAKLEFLIELDHENRRDQSGIRLHGLAGSRAIWRIHRWCHERRIKRMAKFAHALFRAKARQQLRASTEAALIIHLLYNCLDRMEQMTAPGNR
jgi:hypothetical protein